jgi:hypothetical protein
MRVTHAVTGALLDSEAALERALVAIERRTDARQVIFAWANLGECSRRLARYITEVYPDRKGGALLANTLEAAFRAYEAAEPTVEAAPARAYLQSLLSCAPRVVAFDLFGRRADGRTVRWAPFAEPVTDWAREQALSELIFEPAHTTRRRLSEHESLRWLLCARVLRFEDVAILHDERPPAAPMPTAPRARGWYLKQLK